MKVYLQNGCNVGFFVLFCFVVFGVFLIYYKKVLLWQKLLLHLCGKKIITPHFKNPNYSTYHRTLLCFWQETNKFPVDCFNLIPSFLIFSLDSQMEFAHGCPWVRAMLTVLTSKPIEQRGGSNLQGWNEESHTLPAISWAHTLETHCKQVNGSTADT